MCICTDMLFVSHRPEQKEATAACQRCFTLLTNKLFDLLTFSLCSLSLCPLCWFQPKRFLTGSLYKLTARGGRPPASPNLFTGV